MNRVSGHPVNRFAGVSIFYCGLLEKHGATRGFGAAVPQVATRKKIAAPPYFQSGIQIL